jgi:hypothetical protein
MGLFLPMISINNPLKKGEFGVIQFIFLIDGRCFLCFIFFVGCMISAIQPFLICGVRISFGFDQYDCVNGE